MAVSIKSPQEIEKMRVAGRLAAEVLDFIAPHVKAGATTDHLDQLCHDYMCCTRAMMSSRRSRSGGRWIATTWRR